MKRTIPPIFFFFAVSVFMVDPSWASSRDIVEIARKHLDDGEYLKAATLLEKEKIVRPDDASLHFLLGVCYLREKKDSLAHQSFSVATQIDPTYVQATGDAYFNIGLRAFKEGTVRKSRIYFQKAIKYAPNLQKKIAEYTFKEGKRLYGRGEYELADERFSVSNAFDSTYSEKICDMYFQLGNSLDGNDSLYFYEIAGWYSSSHNEEIGLRLLQLAQSQTTDDLREKFKSEAAKYIGEKTVRTAFPEPSWTAVHVSTYSGKGYDEFNSPEYHIRTIRYGKEIMAGDRVLVESEGPIRVWDNGWQEWDKQITISPEIRTPGEYLYVQGPKGKNVTVKVQRFQ